MNSQLNLSCFIWDKKRANTNTAGVVEDLVASSLQRTTHLLLLLLPPEVSSFIPSSLSLRLASILFRRFLHTQIDNRNIIIRFRHNIRRPLLSKSVQEMKCTSPSQEGLMPKQNYETDLTNMNESESHSLHRT